VVITTKQWILLGEEGVEYPLEEEIPTAACESALLGCCLDGTTEKTDEDGTNCPACESSTFGCCSDGTTEKTDEAGTTCPVEEVEEEEEEEEETTTEEDTTTDVVVEEEEEIELGNIPDSIDQISLF